MTTQIVVVGALIAFAGACRGAESFILASPEKTATVVVRADAEASSRLAAEEFAAYVGKVTGRTPQIAETAPASGTRVVIGTQKPSPTKE